MALIFFLFLCLSSLVLAWERSKTKGQPWFKDCENHRMGCFWSTLSWPRLGEGNVGLLLTLLPKILHFLTQF